MKNTSYQPHVVDTEKTAFAVWLGRALKSCHEDAVHEPLPAELLKLLPPATQPQR